MSCLTWSFAEQNLGKVTVLLSQDFTEYASNFKFKFIYKDNRKILRGNMALINLIKK